MLIKQQALIAALDRKLAEIYILFGPDHFLLSEAAESIKMAWRKKCEGEGEESIITVASIDDWRLLRDEANSYSLFSNNRLINVRYDKKTLDAPAKEFFSHYLNAINSQCLILIQAPNLTLKALQGLVSHDSLQIIQALPLTGSAVQQWIASELQKNDLLFEQQVPALIQQYTQGNMLACSQVIEKLTLVSDKGELLTAEIVKEQLVDQCDYQLFELTDACLNSNSDQAILLLRHARHSKVEPTLVLWILTQETRLLIQLLELMKQNQNINNAGNQLKIWSNRIKLYQTALKHQSLEELFNILRFCKTIDERIKSNQAPQVWHALEQLALSLCLGKQVGFFA